MMSICDFQEIWALHMWLASLGERSAGWLGDGKIYVHTPFSNVIIYMICSWALFSKCQFYRINHTVEFLASGHLKLII